MAKVSTNGPTNTAVRAMIWLVPSRRMECDVLRFRFVSMEENFRILYGVQVRHHHLSSIAQSVGCLYKVKIQVKIWYLAIEPTEWDHVWMFGAHVKILKNPEDWLETLPTVSICPKPKKNQTHWCLRICHHDSGRILLLLVRCTCFCEAHVQFFEHLSIWSFTLVTYVYLMYLMRLVRKVEG